MTQGVFQRDLLILNNNAPILVQTPGGFKNFNSHLIQEMEAKSMIAFIAIHLETKLRYNCKLPVFIPLPLYNFTTRLALISQKVSYISTLLSSTYSDQSYGSIFRCPNNNTFV